MLILVKFNNMMLNCFGSVGGGSSSQTYLGEFLKEGAIESDDGDIEDNRAPSLTSSKSNLSDSIVSFHT